MSHPSKKSSPAWSFPGKQAELKPDAVPGPGSYPVTPAKSQKAGKIGKSVRTGLASPKAVPGPGTYELRKQQQEGPQYSMRTRCQSARPERVSGGYDPGQYDPKDANINDSVSYSISAKEKPRNRFQAPGPGTYEYKPSMSTNGVRVGTARRKASNETAVPGPGTYEASGKIEGRRFGFGSSSKQSSIFVEKKTPGPGSYSMNSTLAKGSVLMVPRRPDFSPEVCPRKGPGPGAYEGPNRFGKRGFSLGRGGRSDFTKNDGVPGPGNYAVKTSKATSFSFGKSNRQPINRPSTGAPPGSYEIPDKGKEGPSYSLSKRTKEIDKRLSPGPGTYEPVVEEQTRLPNTKFGNSTRAGGTKSGVPGPGNYEVRKQLGGPKYSFGHERQRSMEKKQVHSGSFYEVPATIPNVASYALR